MRLTDGDGHRVAAIYRLYFDDDLRVDKKTSDEEFEKKELECKRYNKLADLEDIEQELGIDLITLFKALKNGIYIKPNNIYVGSPYLCFAENENRELEFQFKIVDTWYKVKDYGKTWTLTGDEIEK